MEGRGVADLDFLPLDWERAGATFLRHALDQLIESCNTGNTGNVSTRFQELVEGAKSALLTTDAGTYYTLDEARTVLDRRYKRGQQGARIKGKP